MKLIQLFFFLFSVILYSQVGINTNNPKATVDVIGSPKLPYSVDGILAPKLTLLELNKKVGYALEQKGAFIYITEINYTPLPTETNIINVTTPGYYVFNGTSWGSLETQVGEVYFKAIGGAKTVTGNWTQSNIPLNVVENIGGGVYDGLSYTIPVTGTYFVSARIQVIDNTFSRAQFLINVTANPNLGFFESPTAIWTSLQIGSTTAPFFRILYFKKGDKVRLTTFFDITDGNSATPNEIKNSELILLLFSGSGN